MSKTLEDYTTIFNVARACKSQGISICLNSLVLRIKNGKIPGVIRDPDDPRGRRLIPIGEIPNIIAYYTEILEVRKREQHTLSRLAKDIGLKKERSIYPIAKRLGIKTRKLGNYSVMDKQEYNKWRIILSRQKRLDRNYLSTGFIAKQWGTTHYLIIYYIKTGKIPGKKINRNYKILRRDFEEYGEEWRQQCMHNIVIKGNQSSQDL